MTKALERVLQDDGNSAIRTQAAGGLVNWGTPKSLPVLREAAQRDPDQIVSSTAKAAIDAINLRYELAPATTPGTVPGTPEANDAPKSPEDLAAVVADLDSGDFGRCVRATMRLLRGKPREPNPKVAKALERVLLEDGNDAIRVNAAMGLANWGTTESAAALQEAAEKDSNPGVRSRAKAAIEAIKRRQ